MIEILILVLVVSALLPVIHWAIKIAFLAAAVGLIRANWDRLGELGRRAADWVNRNVLRREAQ